MEREYCALRALAGAGTPYLPVMLLGPCTLQAAAADAAAQQRAGGPALVTTRLGVPLHERLAWQYSSCMRPGQSLLLAASLAAATHCLQVGVCARGSCSGLGRKPGTPELTSSKQCRCKPAPWPLHCWEHVSTMSGPLTDWHAPVFIIGGPPSASQAGRMHPAWPSDDQGPRELCWVVVESVNYCHIIPGDGEASPCSCSCSCRPAARARLPQ